MITTNRFWPRLFGMLGASLLLGTSLPGSAGATTYNESISFKPADVVCDYFGTTQLCTQFVPFASPRTGAANDLYNISVDLHGPLYIPGSQTSDLFLVNLIDAGATFGPGGIGGDIAKSHIDFVNYLGPANPIAGGGTTAWDQGYYAVSGFCCGYGTPNGGFSLDGAAATIKLITTDPKPLAGMAITMSVDLGLTPTVLTNFVSGGSLHPTPLPAGVIGAVSGHQHGFSPFNYVMFDWDGGQFEALGKIDGDFDPFILYTFDIYDLDHGVYYPGSLGPDHAALMNRYLPAGRYSIGMDSPDEWSIQFLTPVQGIAVPEPAAWALMLLGFGALGYRLRRARASSSAGVAA